MKHPITCIKCPIGCSLTVETEGDEVVSVIGNKCPKGDDYGRKEILAPERIVTTTVCIKGGKLKFLPVKTSAPVPRGLTFDVVRLASEVTARAPVAVGDVIIAGVAGTRVDLVATRKDG